VQPASARLAAVSDSVTAFVRLEYAVRTELDAWVLPDAPVPESIPHDDAAEHLRQVLLAWQDRAERPLRVARNLALRWLRSSPQVGIDPDVCVLDPAPPGFEDLTSLCLWLPGHVAPPLCFEVVSAGHPHKDYRDVHERYAALGVRELVVFDPLLAGPRSLGGPVPLQYWRRDTVFTRVYAGAGPVFSETLRAWVHAAGRHLAICDDHAGAQCWSTREERERAEKERERAEKERERAEKERERAEKERERAEKERERAGRLEVEEKLAALELRMREVESRRS
jgi:hypothetical protein